MKLSPGLKHKLNPLHVYCRLMDMGIFSKNSCGKMTCWYENHVFKTILAKELYTDEAKKWESKERTRSPFCK